MFFMSCVAIFQNDIRKMLAFSSIGQVGYMLLGISFFSMGGLTATLVTLFNHGITKATLFMSLGLISFKSGGAFLNNISGAGRKYPLTCLAFLVGGLSLVGIPGTAGFISKWLLVVAALEKGLVWLAFLIVASSLLTLIYMWIVVEKLYFGEETQSIDDNKISLLSLISVWFLAGCCIYFGLNTDLTLGAADIAVNSLFNK
jgi:multicomponent Na+:H+ antiporter subunit D